MTIIEAWERVPGLPGALVISLDFELMWGVRDIVGHGDPYLKNVRGVREAIPRILELFGRHGVGATWATVGGLFATSFEEFEEYLPNELPTYVDANLSPYGDLQTLPKGHEDLYFAPDLVAEVAAYPNQELASHTFSHFYCLEPGQTVSQFVADMASAVSIASAKGYTLSSLVFPRNQLNQAYLPALEQLGFTAVRGASAGPASGQHVTSDETLLHRGVRLLDSLIGISGPGSYDWPAPRKPTNLTDVHASRFLRPFSRNSVLNELALRRVLRGMAYAAEHNQVFHLWWHPHNFGVSLAENLTNLDRVLQEFGELQDATGFTSYTMRDVVRLTMRAHEREPLPAVSTGTGAHGAR